MMVYRFTTGSQWHLNKGNKAGSSLWHGACTAPYKTLFPCRATCRGEASFMKGTICSNKNARRSISVLQVTWSQMPQQWSAFATS